MTRRVFSVLVVLFCLAAFPAAADVVTYNLTSDHCSGGGGCSTGQAFGTITLTDVATGVQMKVTLGSDYQFVGTGFDATIAWNLIGNPTVGASGLPTDWTLMNGGVPQTGQPSPNDWVKMDGAGNFEYGVYCNPCNGGSNPDPGPVTFTVTFTGLTVGDFAEKNTAGQYFAVDVLSANGKTGAIDASDDGTCTSCTQETTPEPTSIALLGGVVLCTVGAIRRRRPKLS